MTLTESDSPAPSTVRDDSPPTGSKIEVFDDTNQRLLLYIPAAGKYARSLSVFVVFWIGFLIADLLFEGVWQRTAMGIFVSVVLWLVGLVVLVQWLKMRFTRTYLLLEPERLVLEQVLFGRKSIRETLLGPASHAQLVEAYSENDATVHGVHVDGIDGVAKFGAHLAWTKKVWLVDRINQFLRREIQPPQAQ